MTRIADAKKAFSKALDEELDAIRNDLVAVAIRLRDAGSDAQGLNKLAQGFNGIASTVETAIRQTDEARNEQRAWLGVSKPEITERTNADLVAAVVSGKGVEA